MTKLDVEIQLRKLPREAGWLVDLRSVEPPASMPVEPLRDADLASLDLPPGAQTWKGFLASLSPNPDFVPSSATLRAVGGLIMERVLGSREVARHLAGVELRAEREERAVRLLLEVDESDPVLSCLPVELAFDGDRFVFKRSGYPSFRIAPYSEARNLHLGRGSRVLIATAHSDEAPDPDRAALAAHATAVQKAVRAAGFKVLCLPDATHDGLREALLAGPPVDLLYVVCHGIEDPDHAGQLVLRNGSLFGEDLAGWLERAVEAKRPVQAVVLCACSSAPRAEEGTLGMAQWLVRPGRALAALGFRGPVLVSWALRWSERLFRRLGEGDSLEDAFAHARSDEPDGETQWVLPVLYARRRDPDADLRLAVPRATVEETVRGPVASASVAGPPLPRRPRPYFTGRTRDLEVLREWARTPGAAQITAVQGWGGIGKSELATVLAHEERAAGRLVVWLDRPDKDVPGAQTALVGITEPGFRAASGASRDDLAARVRHNLGSYNGLLVLDDITDRTVLDPVLPGGNWNVLVTTRVRGLLPGAFEVNLQPLETEEALRLLSLVAWSTEEPPPPERDAAERLIERLGRLPLALELAGATLRDLVSAQEYLESLDLDEGVAASDQAKVEATLLRTLTDMEEADKLAFMALGILPASGVPAEVVAETLGEPRPRVTRRLDRLVRYSLAMWSPETERYTLHPFLRRAALARARDRSRIWNDLHAGAARALEALASWIREPGKAELVRERWNRHRKIFETLDPSPWRGRAQGRQQIESALRFLGDLLPREKATRAPGTRNAAEAVDSDNDFPIANTKVGLGLSTPDYAAEPAPAAQIEARRLKEEGDDLLRQGHLMEAYQRYDRALALYQADGDLSGQAVLLKARGDLQLRRSDMDGALQDYDQARSLFLSAGDPLGEASVLVARGELYRLRTDSGRAAADFESALALYEAAGFAPGKANVLKAYGNLRQDLSDFPAARRAYDEALSLYREAGDLFGQANLLVARGELHRLNKQFPEASADLEEARRLFEALGHRLGLANTLQVLGDMERDRHLLAKARQSYEIALELYRELQDPRNIANVLAELARVSELEGDTGRAESLASEAISLSTPSENAYATELAEEVQRRTGTTLE